jgi:hypothetical protein
MIDSNGKEMPKAFYLPKRSNKRIREKALSISLLLACGRHALENGLKIEYCALDKTLTVISDGIVLKSLNHL